MTNSCVRWRFYSYVVPKVCTKRFPAQDRVEAKSPVPSLFSFCSELSKFKFRITVSKPSFLPPRKHEKFPKSAHPPWFGFHTTSLNEKNKESWFAGNCHFLIGKTYRDIESTLRASEPLVLVCLFCVEAKPTGFVLRHPLSTPSAFPPIVISPRHCRLCELHAR